MFLTHLSSTIALDQFLADTQAAHENCAVKTDMALTGALTTLLTRALFPVIDPRLNAFAIDNALTNTINALYELHVALKSPMEVPSSSAAATDQTTDQNPSNTIQDPQQNAPQPEPTPALHVTATDPQTTAAPSGGEPMSETGGSASERADDMMAASADQTSGQRDPAANPEAARQAITASQAAPSSADDASP